MSGHSKWHKIKHAKEATDKKKGKVFGQFSKEIASAIRQGGICPETNALLRDAIARAKKANIPQANIDRILSGKDDSQVEEVTYEGFGPGGAALLITVRTDNANRTVSEIRNLLSNHSGSLSGPNSVRWKFSNDLTPKYPIQLSPGNKQALQELIDELNHYPDITQVVTDTADDT